MVAVMKVHEALLRRSARMGRLVAADAEAGQQRTAQPGQFC